MSKNYDFFLRIGVDGERCVGKSSLISKFAETDFKNGKYEETLQVYVTTTHVHLDNYTIKVEFLEAGWNLKPNKNYYSYIDGAILVYDVSKTNGLEKIKELSREYTNTDSDYVTNKIPIMIIANKWDEYRQKRVEFLYNVTSKEEKTSASIEEILKKCISRLLDFKEISDLNELTSPNNQLKLMMEHAIKLYLYGIPKKIIYSRRKQLEVPNEEMDGIKSFLSLEEEV
ncbi:P-loop containing nucleoside triphosphate hydrolase protein [Gigaspora rosea]|uniref:P-loop containing nucleoside triphosphate hydrolase protein n=1 Tax=Gigaspora rosea TaxID=44941 RepID=A0A397VMP5_9GLOM|nr:P-loop containing nucleoside triphosphate hydrolase protein [Gigaspora rosea]